MQSTAHANADVERFIGSVRRECLDHVIVCSKTDPRRTLQAYTAYYLHSRTHLALDKDAPVTRTAVDPAEGTIGGPSGRGSASPLRAARGVAHSQISGYGTPA